MRLTVDDGTTTVTQDISVDVGGGGGKVIKKVMTVVMEAEVYDVNVAVGGQSWSTNTDVAGYTGDGLVTASPNSGTNINTGYTGGGSARLDYSINFSTTGTYYVWLRGSAITVMMTLLMPA